MTSHQTWLSHYNVNPHLATPISILLGSLLFAALCGIVTYGTAWSWRTIAVMLIVDRFFYHALGRLVLGLWQPQQPGWLTAAIDYMYVAQRTPKWFIAGPHLLPALLMQERTLDTDIVLLNGVVIVVCVLSLYQQGGKQTKNHFL